MIKRKIIVLAAVVICLSAAFGIGGYLTNSSDAAESKQPKTEAVKVSETVPASEKKTDKEIPKKAENVKSADPINDPIKPARKNESNKTVAKPSQKNEGTKSEPKSSEKVTKTEPAQPKTPTHKHDWEAVYTYETVEDISSKLVEICKGCGADITSWSTDKWNEHQKQHMLNGENSGFYEKEVKYVSGTHQIKHLNGYRCSCGATK